MYLRGMKILLVEDDDSLSKILRQTLAEDGYDLHLVEDGHAALAEGKKDIYDLIVLDIMIPGISGLEVCKKLRSDDVRTPILIVTAKDRVEDKVAGLDAGADDYLVKPYHLAELSARVRALLRRASVVGGPLNIGGVILDPSTRELRKGNKSHTLSTTEYFLIEYLMKNPSTVRTRGEILMQVWKYDFDGNDNVLDVYISYLRKKLDYLGVPNFIKTVRGVGFVIEEAHSAVGT